MRSWFLPALYVSFALISTSTLASVAPAIADKQFLSFLIGGVVFAVAARIPWSTYKSLAWPSYWIAVFLLILPLVAFGAIRNTHRWIELGGGQTFQPSQVALPLTLLALSLIITKAQQHTWQVLGKFLTVLSLPAALIFVEPDLGTTIAYVVPCLVILLVAPIPWKQLATLVITGVLLAVAAWFFLLLPYQKERITTFLNPESADNHNAHQALIAVGSGMWWGRGIGQGVQSHLKFLPERHTDFIFASFAEEYGFLGSSLLLLLYGALVAFLLKEARSIVDPDAQLLYIVTAFSFVFQASINILMNMGMMPITGITLPFISYGGSSIVSLTLLLGMTQSASIHRPAKVALHLT